MSNKKSILRAFFPLVGATWPISFPVA
ncbi:GhoT/OrtT family toxin [Salmonella enterica]|nr:GhoT/OrtT family toxin [Salmonella enterica]